MTQNQSQGRKNPDSELSKLILEEYPYPIAVNYRQLLEIEDWEKRTRRAIDVFEYGVRAITLGILSQYLIRDLHEVNDPELNKKLYEKLSQPSLGIWMEFLFLSLRAYEGHRERFFMPELYDLYWDTSKSPHQPRKGIRGPYDRLVQTRNDLAHRLFPDTDQAWQKMGTETLDNLEQVLAQFSFLKNYDLIRIQGRSGEQYDYERFTGQEITIHRERLKTEKKEKLQAGWFYLSRQDRSVLLLHPLLIHWSNPGDIELLKGGEFDVGVYSRLLKEAVEYIATVVHYTAQESDSNLLAQFHNLIYYNLEKVKMARGPVVKEVTWKGLQSIVQAITDQQMSAVKLKYRKDLYLQRNQTFQQFRDFLASDKRAFVLTGKSGVGKSNFVLSLLDEFAQSEQLLPLLYDGARLSPEGSLAQFITQDLGQRLGLEGSRDGDVFAFINRQKILQDKCLLLVFDAVNENANPGSLLQKIDQIARELDYPWLKVLITSRPQAWRTMKRGLHLAEDRYYQPQDSDERWVEMVEFTVQLEDFRRDELNRVYEKYQREFRLQTGYEDLKSQIRELLRDPLILRLVADIYRGQTIPEQVRSSEIYKHYLDRLIKDNRLRERDLQFLEQELMPLMLYPGHYTNKITASQINQARTSDGRPLWELIHNEDWLSSGERVNASFSRLVDAEVILLQGTPTEYEITFKYERFYEYFAGRRLGVLLQDKAEIAERSQAYAELIAAIRERPYLWGAVQSALLNDLKEKEHDYGVLIEILAQTIDQLTKEMIVSVLTTFGQESLARVEKLCQRLLELRQPVTKKDTAGKDLHEPGLPYGDSATDSVTRFFKATTASRVHMAKKAAIEVAYNLRIARVLEEAARDKESALRAVVAQYVYYLWRDDEEKAFQVLKTISDRIASPWKIPDIKAFEVCLGVSLMMLFFHFGELERREKFLGRLQGMWKRIIGHLLFISPGEGGLTGRLKQALREGVLYFGVRIAMTTIGQAEESGVLFSLPELRSFFPPSEAHKRIFERMVPQMEAVHDESLEPLSNSMETLKKAMLDRDMLTTYATFLALLGNILRRPGETIPVVKELFEYGLHNPPRPGFTGAPPAGPMMPILVWCFMNLLYGLHYSGQQLQREDVSEEILNFYGDFIWRYEEHYQSWCSTDSGKYRIIEIPTYTYYFYLLRGEIDSLLLKDLIDKAKRENDLHALINYVLGFMGIGTYPAWKGGKAAVQSLNLILREVKGTHLYEPLKEPVIRAYANLRAYHPNIVDDALAELSSEEMAPEMKRAIQARGATESLGLLLGIAGAWFARDLLVDPDPQSRELLTWLLFQATRSQSMDQWIRELLKKIMHFVYGEPVFKAAD